MRERTRHTHKHTRIQTGNRGLEELSRCSLVYFCSFTLCFKCAVPVWYQFDSFNVCTLYVTHFFLPGVLHTWHDKGILKHFKCLFLCLFFILRQNIAPCHSTKSFAFKLPPLNAVDEKVAHLHVCLGFFFFKWKLTISPYLSISFTYDYHWFLCTFHLSNVKCESDQ